MPITTEGQKRINEMHSLPKEQIFYNTPQPEAGKGSSDGEVPRKTLESSTPKTGNHCTRSGEEDEKYIETKLNPPDKQENGKVKEEGTVIIPSTCAICKSSRIKNSPSDKQGDFLW